MEIEVDPDTVLSSPCNGFQEVLPRYEREEWFIRSSFYGPVSDGNPRGGIQRQGPNGTERGVVQAHRTQFKPYRAISAKSRSVCSKGVSADANNAGCLGAIPGRRLPSKWWGNEIGMGEFTRGRTHNKGLVVFFHLSLKVCAHTVKMSANKVYICVP